ncbi:MULTISPECIES: hypothetical protein [Dyadobacter]|jgi:hypothetical protein|uniref:DKNYY family protein n=1 Tax=Dyadobacter chenhuakuii TaxID=2909339 RepID=A0ABY4XFL5_9BACT|nr:MULTISPECIES: hypothetical protein [Dyadobacter]MCF2495169.1 hypothetical protein [Dyadobacter chenhuakuii]MCF2516248.1 hypothetical protein [Dyadobacter sp. CY351]USJ29212.1 hypothetical protein NFI80_15150 [Dyadobacter chenhuakuii]
MRICTFTIFLLSCLAFQSFGQNGGVAEAKETAYPIAMYKEATSQSQNLYNGRQYYVYDNRSEEHQFFEFRKWHNGVIMYDGQRFDSIPMLYDIFKDELIIKHFNGDHILLQSEKVDYFKVDNHNFVRYEAGKDINEQMRTGFYDVLYEGKSRTIVRRVKQRQEKIVDKMVIALYPQKNNFFIRKGDRYYGVSSKKSALNLFPEYKRELRKVLKDQRIKFRKNRETAIVTIVDTYDKLAKQ